MLVLLRHGETEWSRDMRHTSRTDVRLTAVGRDQALRTGRSLAGQAFSLILVSPRERARETLELMGLSGPVEVDEHLAEWDYGEYEGRSTAEIREERPGWDLWADGAPGGEPIEDLGARADWVIERALAVEGDVAIIAHGHLLRVLGARWIGLPPAGGALLALDTASTSMLGYERERRVIRLWNAPS
jgi:probable phosphoglycerate mutase